MRKVDLLAKVEEQEKNGLYNFDRELKVVQKYVVSSSVCAMILAVQVLLGFAQ